MKIIRQPHVKEEERKEATVRNIEQEENSLIRILSETRKSK
jgi:hypothetical protein